MSLGVPRDTLPSDQLATNSEVPHSPLSGLRLFSLLISLQRVRGGARRRAVSSPVIHCIMVWSINAAYVMTLELCKFPVDTTSCALFHISVPGGGGLISPGRRNQIFHLWDPPTPHPGCLFLWLVLFVFLSYHSTTARMSGQCFPGSWESFWQSIKPEGGVYVCIHARTHFTSEGYEDVFLYSLWSYYLAFIFHKDLQYWNRFLWIMYEPSCMSQDLSLS